MISLTDKKECCGCNACGDICSQKAITFNTDNEGFWYPETDTKKCTNCGLCEKVCPVLNIEQLKKNDFEKPNCYAAIHKNLEVRFDSTSGGLFSALAEKMYKDGGYVGGAVYNGDFSVSQYISNDKQDIVHLRSSKYQQSDFAGFFNRVQDILKTEGKVLVCGCPCQMAALRTFLGKDYENLLIADFVCRGINSPLVAKKYRESLEAKYRSKVVWQKAKNKEFGWRNLTAKYRFADGQNVYITKNESLFNRGFLHTNAFCRPSCYACRFKGFPRIADITIADFWGIEKVDKSMDDNLGTSLVLVNSEKGQIFFDAIQQKIKSVRVSFELMLGGNPALIRSLGSPKINRDAFFNDLQNNDFFTIANKYFPFVQSRKERLRKALRDWRDTLVVTQFKFLPVCQFIYFNILRKNIKTKASDMGFLVPTPHTVIEIGKKADIQLNARLKIGSKKFRKSKLETRLLVENGGTLIVNNRFSFMYGSDIEIFNGGTLIINGRRGGGTNIKATIICKERIEIGDHVMMGRNVTIRDNNGDHYLSQQGYKKARPIIIGNHVWLCEGCTIMPGVKIGDGAIVGAKSVVMTNIPPFSLVSGNPAKIVQTNIYWKH
ncbi:Coenzyme F420 hydrogenase/dehydrogenase, beta subunit C-terminal domain [Treponema primitia]|uniref:Coenzyme F420 hydrogenase/dehydrogenase, beta subunit C-terminal domain n=1 Tax=Treponema primitia TaxID=88058 RepID=UPI000255555E|nr:Coenzyme F420 hydrogenase/dehydrogenase, beta subunit C-terminal domain [Treponema primitia]